MEILTWFPARHFNLGSSGPSLLMIASNPTSISKFWRRLYLGKGQRARRALVPRWWLCGPLPLCKASVRHICIYIPSATEKMKAFLFLVQNFCEKMKTKAFLWGSLNSPSLSQTGIKYSSFHPHSLSPHAHNLNTIRGYEILRTHKIKELDLAEWVRRLFTNTAAHSALLQSARLSITAKGEREKEEEAEEGVGSME